MPETGFEVPVGDGTLHGHRAGYGDPALLLHGGPAVPDYLGECAVALDGLFEAIRYTQRGTPPSVIGPPYTIESHVADALAVLDAFEIERAWAIGHSWGGHLALHLALAQPQRLSGLVLVDALGAYPDALSDQSVNLRRGLTEEQRSRVDEIEDRRRAGAVTQTELAERVAVLWPRYFAMSPPAIAAPAQIGVLVSIETNRSIADHFERQTLLRGLPGLALPVRFVHGEQDPLPVHSATRTAALIPDARVETISDCGHFPWVERPEAFRSAIERLLAEP